MTLARRLVLCLAILALLPWASVAAEALTITTPPTLLYSGNVFYPDVSFTGPGHIIGKTFDTLDSISATVSYDRDDFDFAPYGFRWSEHILNNTGVPWTGFHVEISAGEFLNVAAGLNSVPGQASINFLTTPPTVTLLSPTNGTTFVLSNSNRTVDFFLASSIGPGQYLDLHIPMLNVPGGIIEEEYYSFTLTQQPQSVPEPGTLVLLGFGFTGLVAWGWRRRGRSVTPR